MNAQIQDGIKGLLPEDWPSTEPSMITPDPNPVSDDKKIIKPEGNKKPCFAANINKHHIFIALLLCLLAVGLVWISKNKEDAFPLDVESKNIKIIEAYFVADKKALDKKDIGVLSQFFRFPIYYYTRNYTEEEFENHYIESVSRYKEKDVRIDSIVSVPNTDNTKYRVYGEQRKYKKDKNSYTVGRIKDEFILKDNKIVSVAKMY